MIQTREADEQEVDGQNDGPQAVDPAGGEGVAHENDRAEKHGDRDGHVLERGMVYPAVQEQVHHQVVGEGYREAGQVEDGIEAESLDERDDNGNERQHRNEPEQDDGVEEELVLGLLLEEELLQGGVHRRSPW